MFTIRPVVTREAVEYVAENMRGADVEEVWASHGHEPLDALTLSVFNSDLAWTWYRDETPVAIFGVGPVGRDVGSPWFLGTPSMHSRPAEIYFTRTTGRVLNTMHAIGYPILTQFVDARHEHSLKWLQWAGFTIDEFFPKWGYEGRPFFRLNRVQICASQ